MNKNYRFIFNYFFHHVNFIRVYSTQQFIFKHQKVCISSIVVLISFYHLPQSIKYKSTNQDKKLKASCDKPRIYDLNIIEPKYF